MFFKKSFARSAFSAVTCVLLAAIPALAELEGTITVQGSKQGTFTSGHVVAVRTSIVSPRDPQSRTDVGRRQHGTMVITKEIDAASPMYVKALVGNEILKEVVIEFKSPRGKSPRTLRLMDALITGVRRAPRAGGRGENEEISFTYRQIEWTYVDGSKSANDSWEAK